jgi:hypothetical protein
MGGKGEPSSVFRFPLADFSWTESVKTILHPLGKMER